MHYDTLLAYFDYWNREHAESSAHSLQFDDLGAFGRFRDLKLYSAFQPILSTKSLRPVGYEALLRARDQAHSPISPATAFKRARSDDEIIYLDRLCRMVHALNFFTQSGALGDLYLNVSGRHLLSVSNEHGRTFETLLKHCGLKPTQIVLEIIESRVSDLSRLQVAVDAYRSRGFRVAIDDFGCQHSNFDRLWRLTPDIVKLDRSLIVQADNNLRARRILPKLVDIIHELGAIALCEGIETPAQHALAIDAGSDLLQGYHYARPSPEVWRPETPPASAHPTVVRADALAALPA